MHVETMINGKKKKNTQVLINTRASQNFIKVDEAKHLSFKYEKTNSWLKTVNSEAKTLSGGNKGCGATYKHLAC